MTGFRSTLFVAALLTLSGCSSAAPAATPSIAVATVTPTPTPTPTIMATERPTPKATLGKPYEDVFGGLGGYTSPDPLPFVAGRRYLVDWSYDPAGSPCAFQSGFQAPGAPSFVQFARSVSASAQMAGKSTITWATEDGTDPRLIVASQCLWVVTVRELR